MSIDSELINKKLGILDRHLTAIERMDFDQETFVENPDIHDLVTFRLQQAVETCIDIATHIIASLNLPRKETAKDAFILLGDEHIISSELAAVLGKAADFRNRVVHGYNDFDFRLLFALTGRDPVITPPDQFFSTPSERVINEQPEFYYRTHLIDQAVKLRRAFRWKNIWCFNPENWSSGSS